MSSGIEVESGAAFEPLTEQEIKTISRLLSDPSVFPRPFKRWVTDHAGDTVDIAKSQVHGLINNKGSLVIPPPPLISQLYFRDLTLAATIGSGATDAVFPDSPPIECGSATGAATADPIVFEVFCPGVFYRDCVFNLLMDGTGQGSIGRMQNLAQAGSSWGQLYLQAQFSPTKGTHTFGLQARAISNSLIMVAGISYDAILWRQGFFRISRA